MHNVYLTSPDGMVEDMLKKQGCNVTPNLTNKTDYAVFTGGADVTPFLYGEHTLSQTFPDVYRDMKEIRIYQSLPTELPKVGICRGAQLLNVLSGGRMWQHVDNHAGADHDMEDTYKGEIIKVTSVHHQMMIPSEAGWVLGVANRSNSKQNAREVWKRSSAEQDAEDVEAVYYSNTNSFCFQPHPEYVTGPCRDWFFSYIDELFARDIERNRGKQAAREVHCG